MTNNELKTIYAFLTKITITKVSDKTTRNAIIKMCLALHKAAEAIEADIKETYKLIIGDKMDQYLAYLSIVEKVSKGHADRSEIDPEMEALDKQVGESIAELLNAENTASFEPVNEESFIDALAEQGIEINCADLFVLQKILKTDYE